MEIHPNFVAERFHEVVNKLSLKRPDHFLLYRHLVHKAWSTADVNHGCAQRFIKRHGSLSKPSDSTLVVQRLPERPSEHQADVFDGMMVVHVKISACLYREVEKAVLGETFYHMVKKRHASGNLALSAAVERQVHVNSGFPGNALNSGASGRQVRRRLLETVTSSRQTRFS